MGNLRRVRRGNTPQLTVVKGGDDDSGGVRDITTPTGIFDDAHEEPDRADLREALVAFGAPDSYLRDLDNGAPTGAVLTQLVEDGILPSPEESLTDLLENWKPLLRRGCDSFTAELTGIEFLAMLRELASYPEQVPELLESLIAQAETTGSEEGLAMVRVLAAVGPEELRGSAAAAGDRMVGRGLRDRPWASGLGKPAIVDCFGYGDEFGAQTALAMTFAYRGRAHAMAVLIDNELGGGVKDCWPSDSPDQVREGYRDAARRAGLSLQEHHPAAAREILERALAAPACPVEQDQIEDVGTYLDLLRQRTLLLPSAARRSPGAGGRSTQPVPTLHQLNITLRGVRPPIWRRIEVPSGFTLRQLHDCVQQVFGWEDYHMWAFATPAGRFGVPGSGLGHGNASSKKLGDVASVEGSRLRYTYDFGDDWEHEILVESVSRATPGVVYPRCLAGRRAAPPEDCGGTWGYGFLVEAMTDPDHPDHEERLEWLGLDSAEEFDPAAFDVAEANQALSKLARVLLPD
jgi:hypothetical protein